MIYVGTNCYDHVPVENSSRFVRKIRNGYSTTQKKSITVFGLIHYNSFITDTMIRDKETKRIR